MNSLPNNSKDKLDKFPGSMPDLPIKLPDLPEKLPELPKEYEALTATQLSYHRTQLSTYRSQLSILRTVLSTQRTSLSFQRTRLSADRTLMSIMRTSLSLIGFGFTIAQFFSKLLENNLLPATRSHAPRNLGLAMVALGIGMLIIGIWYHIQFMIRVRKERERIRQQVTLPEEDVFPVSMTLITAGFLLLLGLAAIISLISAIISS